MTQQVIDNTANAGEAAQTAFGKVNANFTELYGGIASRIVTPTGTLPATSLSYNPLAFEFSSTSDNAADLTGNGTNIPSLVVLQQLYGGSNINDGRNGLSIFTALTAPTSPTNAYRYYVGMTSYSNSFVNDHGTIGSPQGIVEAVTGSSQLTTGATNYFALIGAEFTVSANTGSSTQTKALLMLDNWPTDTVHGSVTDTMILMRAVTGAVGNNTGIQIDGFAGAYPLDTSATFIRLIGPATIFTGIDFGNLGISGNVLQWNTSAFSLSGVGNATLGQGIFTASAGTGSGTALTANGLAGQYASIIRGSSASTQSFGLRVNGGTTAADVAFDIQNQAATADYFIMRGDGSMAMGVPAGTYGLTMSNLGAFNILAPFGNTASALTIGGSPNNWCEVQLGSPTASQSFGLLIKAGTNASDSPLTVQTQAAANLLVMTGTGATKFTGAVGVNGATPPAQMTGWGTPVGGAVVASYNITDAGGANSNTNKAVAEIIAYLKSTGDFGV